MKNRKTVSSTKRGNDLLKTTRGTLWKSEEYLRRIVQNMPVMLDAFDEENRIVAWNRECEKVTGYTAKEMIDKANILESFYPDEEYRAWLLTEWKKRGDEFYNWEIDISCKDGTVKKISWSNISRRFPIPGWKSWAIGVDVTECRKMEEELRRHHYQLEEIVKERTEKLARLNQALLREIAGRKKTEKTLERKNIALREVLGELEIEKKQFKDNESANIEMLLLPILEKLKTEGTRIENKYLDLLERNLKEMTSSFGRKLSEPRLKLTPREIEVCDMIKSGLTSKQIAGLLRISRKTVERHRDKIRKKLNLAHRKINLTSFLQNF